MSPNRAADYQEQLRTMILERTFTSLYQYQQYLLAHPSYRAVDVTQWSSTYIEVKFAVTR